MATQISPTPPFNCYLFRTSALAQANIDHTQVNIIITQIYLILLQWYKSIYSKINIVVIQDTATN